MPARLLADDVTVKIENVSSTVAPKNTDLYHLGTIGPGEQKTVDLVLLSDKNTAPVSSGPGDHPVTTAIDGIVMYAVHRYRCDDEGQGGAGLCLGRYQPPAADREYPVRPHDPDREYRDRRGKAGLGKGRPARRRDKGGVHRQDQARQRCPGDLPPRRGERRQLPVQPDDHLHG